MKKVSLAVAILGAVLTLVWLVDISLHRLESEGLLDLIGREPAIAVSFELESSKTNALIEKMKLELARTDHQGLSWDGKLSESNILVIAVSDWSKMLYFDTVDGLQNAAKAASALSPQDHRSIQIISGDSEVVLVVLAYMIPQLDTWAFDCISRDFAEAMVEISPDSKVVLSKCIENRRY